MENKVIELKQDRNFFVMIIILGILANEMCFISNDFKMPVFVGEEGILWGDSLHFTYQNINDVNLWILSDFMSIPFIKRQIYFSIGDVLIMLSLLAMILTTLEIRRIKKGR